jgi:hypothetical protein
MNEIIERVARVLYDHYGDQGDRFYVGEWEAGARAAIAAMETPTPDMLEAGKAALRIGANAFGVWSHMYFFATHKFPDGSGDVPGTTRPVGKSDKGS